MDDTTDDGGFGLDQGKVRVAKVFAGDLDNDEIGDLVFSSASFAADKPHIFFLEHSGILNVEFEKKTIPGQMTILQNYPNPFNPTTKFTCTINSPGRVSLKVYNVMGKLVRTIFQEYKEEGTFEVHWNGRDDNHQSISSGIYFYRFSMEGKSYTKKMILSK